MTHRFDFLVLGSGIAGLSYALKVAKLGTVGIITKKESADGWIRTTEDISLLFRIGFNIFS
jgi:protoporphyrinogen oxidase